MRQLALKAFENGAQLGFVTRDCSDEIRAANRRSERAQPKIDNPPVEPIKGDGDGIAAGR